jgi:hypothetical protein
MPWNKPSLLALTTTQHTHRLLGVLPATRNNRGHGLNLGYFPFGDNATAILSMSASRGRYTDLRSNHGMLGGLVIRPATVIGKRNVYKPVVAAKSEL